MPTASSYLRDKMEENFGDSISDEGPINYLEKQGYKLTRGGCWVPPDRVKNFTDVTDLELDCISFLSSEWDMGELLFENFST